MPTSDTLGQEKPIDNSPAEHPASPVVRPRSSRKTTIVVLAAVVGRTLAMPREAQVRWAGSPPRSPRAARVFFARRRAAGRRGPHEPRRSRPIGRTASVPQAPRLRRLRSIAREFSRSTSATGATSADRATDVLRGWVTQHPLSPTTHFAPSPHQSHASHHASLANQPSHAVPRSSRGPASPSPGRRDGRTRPGQHPLSRQPTSPHSPHQPPTSQPASLAAQPSRAVPRSRHGPAPPSPGLREGHTRPGQHPLCPATPFAPSPRQLPTSHPESPESSLDGFFVITAHPVGRIGYRK